MFRIKDFYHELLLFMSLIKKVKTKTQSKHNFVYLLPDFHLNQAAVFCIFGNNGTSLEVFWLPNGIRNVVCASVQKQNWFFS